MPTFTQAPYSSPVVSFSPHSTRVLNDTTFGALSDASAIIRAVSSRALRLSRVMAW